MFAHSFLIIYGTPKNEKFPLSKWTSNTSFDQLSFTDDQQIKAKTTLVVHSEWYLSLVLSLHMKAKKFFSSPLFVYGVVANPVVGEQVVKHCVWQAAMQYMGTLS